MKAFITLVSISTAAAALDSSSLFDADAYASGNCFERDVVVIGGGSSGTYAATQLQIAGKSVLIIEKENRLGGPTATYKDPASGVTVDYGVQAYWNTSWVRDYFGHYQIPITEYLFHATKAVNVDFSTGQALDAPADPPMDRYAAQLDKYPYLAYSWNLPEPTPEDLLLPFRDFVAKYGLQDLAFEVYFFSQGMSNFLDQLTVNVFKFIDQSFLSTHAVGGHLQIEDHYNQDLYNRALAAFGPDAWLSSTVHSSKRPAANGDVSDGILLVVDTPSGRKLVKAKKLLLTIPPMVDNLKPFGLDSHETELFSQWTTTSYYTAVFNNTGLTTGTSFVRTSPDQDTYNIPKTGGPYHISETRIPSVFYSWYANPTHLTEDEVKADISSAVDKLRRLVGSNVTDAVNFLAFKDASPFKLVVSADAIRKGFYDKLENLQGYRDTWYTGAAFISHDGPVIWNFTRSIVLPSMFE